MRITKPKTDLDLDFKVYADGKPCPEFTLPDRAVDANAAECFIAVPENATIRIGGTFSGSVLHARVDILADGSFVKGRMIDAPNHAQGKIKYHTNRKVEFKEFLHVPDPRPDPNRPHQKPHVVGGNLVLQQLPASTNSRFLDGDGDTLGVGSLALVFSCNQIASKTHGKDGVPAYPDNTLGAWRRRRDQVHGVGIRAEHECSVEPYNDSNPANAKKANTFWRDFALARFGDRPIATMVFYYRTQAAIDAAGGVQLTESVELGPYDGHFTSVMDLEGQEGTPAPDPSKMKPTKSLGIGQPLILNGSSGGMAPPPRGLLAKHARAETDGMIGSMIRNYQDSVSEHDAGRARREAQPGSNQTALPEANRPSVGGDRKQAVESGSVEIKEEDTEEAVSAVPSNQPAAVSHVPPRRRKDTSEVENPARPVVTESAHQNILPKPALPTGSAAPTPASIARAQLTQNGASPVQTPATAQASNARSKSSASTASPAARPPTAVPDKRPATDLPSPAKRVRNEEFEAKKAALVAAAAERKARKEKMENEKREREEMQRKWEQEQEARRRAEEETRRVVQAEMERKRLEEEEAAAAMEAELAALAQEGADEDAEIAAMEAQAEQERLDFEARMRERRS